MYEEDCCAGRCIFFYVKRSITVDITDSGNSAHAKSKIVLSVVVQYIALCLLCVHFRLEDDPSLLQPFNKMRNKGYTVSIVRGALF